jgi:O-antigen/teichoic acid export membrane protein
MSAQVNRRRALVVSDQGISSLSNVVVTIFVARSLSAVGFGAFGVAIVAFMLVQGVSRALVGETLLSRYSSVDTETRGSLVPDMLAAAVAISAVGVAVVTVVAVAAGGEAGRALLALGIVLPLVTVQDTWRYIFIIDRPAAAVAVDAVWLVAVCAVLSAAPSDAGAAWFVIAWGATAGIGAIAGGFLGRGDLAMPHPLRWLRSNRDMGSRFLGEYVTGQAVGQVVLVGVGAIAGLSVIGAVRAAQVFYGPINTVHQGIYLALVPEGARSTGEVHLRRLMFRATLLLAGVAGGWMWLGLLLPDSWGTTLFGETWPEAGGLLLPIGLAMIAGSAATGAFAGVRALGDARESLRARLRTVGPQLVLPLVGAAVGAGHGYAFGFGLGHAASAVIWWAAFGNALASSRKAASDRAGADPRALGPVVESTLTL